MNEIIVSLAFVISCAFSDRARGNNSLAVVLFAYVISTQFNTSPAMILAVMAGEFAGWGNPMGAILNREPMRNNYHWWQFGVLRRNKFLAITFRGLMFGLPPALVGYYYAMTGAIYLLPIITLAFVFSVYDVSRRLKDKTEDEKMKAMEKERGSIIGILILIATRFG